MTNPIQLQWEDIFEWGKYALKLLGKENVFHVREKALINMTKEAIVAHGTLLGGKLTVTLEFDGSKP